jgi:Rrf2 family transcriptional regulator, cysteine metabolism repressor
MQLSKRTQYGLRAMICLTDAYHHGFLQTRELTARENLPTKFLESILSALTRGKFLISKIGATGGYRLAMEPRQILVGDIVTHLEGKKLLAEHAGAVNLEAGHPPGELAVRIVEVDLTAAVREVLNKMTLADLAEQVSQRGQMYYI